MKYTLSVITLLIFFISACDDTSMEDRVNYDKSAFLENTVDNLIIPAFGDFSTKADALNAQYSAFEADPTEENLQVLQNALKDSWLSYQYVAYLQIGPSAELFFRDEVNIFPADTLE
ncbi:MAG: imelysin family protein, partial [Nitrososphaeraceae archaeon]|nr:imelysin family protein [Nitrososphaeraceae archaeon]